MARVNRSASLTSGLIATRTRLAIVAAALILAGARLALSEPRTPLSALAAVMIAGTLIFSLGTSVVLVRAGFSRR